MADAALGWLKSTKASLEGHVKEIRENSKLIAADVASNVKDLEKAGRKIQQTFSIAGNGVLAPGLEEVRLDVTFQQGSLGLNLDLAQGGQVLKISPGGQAEALGLRVEDRVVSIGGEALPAVSDASFQEELKKKLSTMPRPVDMTFVRIQTEKSKENKEKETKETNSEEKQSKESPKMTDLQVKLDDAIKDAQTAREEAASLAAELKLRKSWAAQETEELEALRSEVEDLRAKLEEAGKNSGLEKQVLQLTSKCSELESRSREAEERVAHSSEVLEQEKSRCSEAMQELAAARSKETDLHSKLQLTQQALKDQEAAVAAEGDEKAQRLQTSLLDLQRLHEDVNLAKGRLEAEVLQLTSKRSELESRSREAEERVAQSSEVLEQEKSRCSEAMQELAAARSKEEKMEETQQLLEQQLAETKASRSQLREELRRAEEELEETDALKRRIEELERPGEMTERLSKLQSLCGSQREQLRELELERDALREELQKAEVDLQAAVQQPKEVQAVVYGKEQSEPEPREDAEAKVYENQSLLEPDDTRRVAKLQARVGELEAKNAALQRSLSQRPIVYQFAPPDEGLDPTEDAEPDDDEESQISTACSLMKGGCRLAIRRCWKLWILCRKLKCMSAGENQLRWFTRRLLEKPFLLWVFYFHVLMLWLIEIWRQALSKPLSMDPALLLESAVTKAHARSGA